MPRKAKPAEKSESRTSTARTTLSHAQFFQVASYIEKHRDYITSAKLNAPQVVDKIKLELGILASEHAVIQACETVGVVLYSQKVRANAHKLSGPEVIHILAREIQAMQHALGASASEDFKTLLERL